MKIILRESQLLFLLKEQRGGSNKLDTKKFIDKSKNIHVDEYGNPKYDYSMVEYIDSNTPVKIICPKHKEDWIKKTGNEYFEIIPSKHTSGQGCRFDYLESKQKYSNQDLEDEALKYKTTAEFKKNAPLYFNSANKRGREFYDKITSHFVPEKESAGENFVAKVLVKNGFIDEKCAITKKCENREKTFENCTNTIEGRYCRQLKFDFYIPDINTIIEYDGEQHFKPSTKFGGEKFEMTKENDSIKNKFCLDNNINLIRIHYKVPFDKISKEILNAIDNPRPLTLIGPY